MPLMPPAPNVDIASRPEKGQLHLPAGVAVPNIRTFGNPDAIASSNGEERSVTPMSILTMFLLASAALIFACVLYMIGEERGEDAFLYGLTGLLLGPLALLLLWFPADGRRPGRMATGTDEKRDDDD